MVSVLTVEELVAELEFLGDRDAKCEYLIDLGFELPKLPDEYRTEQNRVHGCQSNVWLVMEAEREQEDQLRIKAQSDAMIVNGLIAVLMAVYDGKSPEEILQTDVTELFKQIGLDDFISPQRRNGLSGMVERIRELARVYSPANRQN